MKPRHLIHPNNDGKCNRCKKTNCRELIAGDENGMIVTEIVCMDCLKEIEGDA